MSDIYIYMKDITSYLPDIYKNGHLSFDDEHFPSTWNSSVTNNSQITLTIHNEQNIESFLRQKTKKVIKKLKIFNVVVSTMKADTPGFTILNSRAITKNLLT